MGCSGMKKEEDMRDEKEKNQKDGNGNGDGKNPGKG